MDLEDLAAAHHGAPMVTARHSATAAEVAAAAGVSRQTVSRVVNGMSNVTPATRDRVLRVMNELGYRPSSAGRALRYGSYRSVGLCVYDIARAGNFATLEGLTRAARDNKCAVTLIEFGEEHPFSLAEASRLMSERPVDGMIINMNRLAPDFEEFTPQAGMRTVILSMYAHPRCTTIDFDQYGCSQMVVERLDELGHRRIAHLRGPETSVSAVFREAGWRDAMTARHLKIEEPMCGDWSADSGYEAGRSLACMVSGSPETAPTALYAANDQMALGAIAALEDAGLSVPHDISVVGVDDVFDGFIPHNRLASVRFDVEERGRIMFCAAMGIVPSGADEVPSGAIRLPGVLVERGSIGAPRR